MNNCATIRLVVGMLAGLLAMAIYAQPAAQLTFIGMAGTSAVENNLRNPDHPSMLVLTLLDANGDRITLCNRAQHLWNAAIATTNVRAAGIQQTVAQAQTTKAKIVLVASEDTADSDGMYCGIVSITTAP